MTKNNMRSWVEERLDRVENIYRKFQVKKVTLREFLENHYFYCDCVPSLIYRDELHGEVKLHIARVEDGYLCVQCDVMPDVDTFEFTDTDVDNYIVELEF